MLPIEDHDPPFTELFRTPHDIDISATAAQFDLEYERVDGREALADALQWSVQRSGTQVLDVTVNAEASHRRRESLSERARTAVREAVD